MKISVILPAKNEAEGLARTLPKLRAFMPDAEIIVVDDGSTDETAAIARKHGAQVLLTPYSMGNGAAIKRGAREAAGDVLVFMDADGQHDPAFISELLKRLEQGYDMVVGARDAAGQANVGRGLANSLYNRLASWMTGHEVADLTSGFRTVRADRFREFLHLLPNGFSYPTTSTMAFFRSAYPVAYVPIPVTKRIGTNSHIRPLRDGVRFLLIIFKIATLYSPLKLFAPAAISFGLLGIGYYGWTFAHYGRFTNMSALLLSAAVIVFLIGLVSEQITALTYRRDL
jgi:glycosyltransferase involved in cell wall biosynthesis